MATDNCITIQLTRGYTTIISFEDADLAALKWQVRINPSGQCYAKRTSLNIGLHRVILAKMIGRDIESKEDVDHINGDTLDNRRENLRLASRSQNQMNRKRSKNNKTGYKGVSQRGKTFHAQITANGKKLHLGQHATAEIAFAVYCEAVKKYHGEFGRTE